MPLRKLYSLIILAFLSIVVLYFYHEDEYGTSSPQAAWHSLLIAMKKGDLQAIESLTTERGLIRLRNNHSQAKNLEDWPNLAEDWLKSEIIYESVGKNSATLHLIPGLIPLGIDFLKDSEGWKIDYLWVGE